MTSKHNPETLKHKYPFLSVRQAMEALDCSRSHLWHLVDRGDMPAPKKLGGRVYYNIEDIMAAMK